MGRVTALFRTVGLTKTYGGVHAVEGAEVRFEARSIHALVGQNGAGKSTLSKMVAGVVRPDGGHIEVDGQVEVFSSPADALAAGVTLVAQELSLVSQLSAAENILLGTQPTRVGLIDRAAVVQRAAEIAADAGFELDVRARVSTMSPSTQQLVEILRALARSSNMIIFDEPTSSLSIDETHRLYKLMRRLADDGMAVVLISHFLDEVLEVADTITVMRDGRVVTTAATTEHTATSLVELMVGAEVELVVDRPPPPSRADTPRLDVEQLSGPGFDNVTLDVAPGEIVAICGLVGSGRSEFLRAVYGAAPITSGTISIDGEQKHFRSPRHAVRAGLAMITESRKTDGIIASLSTTKNISIGHLERISSLGFTVPGVETNVTRTAADSVDVRTSSLEQPITSLSGGNQQKAIFARWLVQPPQLFLVDEPTRGVDVAAIAQIRRLLVNLAMGGMSVLMVTSEFEEALSIAHRIYVFREGSVVGEFSGEDADSSVLLTAAFGTEPSPISEPAL